MLLTYDSISVAPYMFGSFQRHFIDAGDLWSHVC